MGKFFIKTKYDGYLLQNHTTIQKKKKKKLNLVFVLGIPKQEDFQRAEKRLGKRGKLVTRLEYEKKPK